MGHKVHPIGFRLGVVKGWQSRWYAERDYKDLFAEDFMLRNLINKELSNASISRIEIERAATNQVALTIFTAKPGIVIGKSGEKVDKLRALLEAKTGKRVRLNIQEIRQPELDANLVARSIAEQLEKRVSFRRAMKQAVQKSMRANAKGVKVISAGRLGGAEIARTEKEVEGKVPLHTFRADIDYGTAEAHTTFGVIGIKVWVYKGDILPTKRREPGEVQQEANQGFGTRERDGGERPQRGDRPQRPRGDRGDQRGQRPRGDQPQGDRGPRPGSRPQGDRPARAPRPQGEQRGPRPQGDQPQGERAPRAPRPQGERTPRPQGERPARAEQPVQAQPPVNTPAPESQAPSTPATNTGANESE